MRALFASVVTAILYRFLSATVVGGFALIGGMRVQVGSEGLMRFAIRPTFRLLTIEFKFTVWVFGPLW